MEAFPEASPLEQNKILKLFLALHIAGIITATTLSAVNKSDLTTGAGLGFCISSINFGVSLISQSK